MACTPSTYSKPQRKSAWRSSNPSARGDVSVRDEQFGSTRAQIDRARRGPAEVYAQVLDRALGACDNDAGLPSASTCSSCIANWPTPTTGWAGWRRRCGMVSATEALHSACVRISRDHFALLARRVSPSGSPDAPREPHAGFPIGCASRLSAPTNIPRDSSEAAHPLHSDGSRGAHPFAPAGVASRPPASRTPPLVQPLRHSAPRFVGKSAGDLDGYRALPRPFADARTAARSKGTACRRPAGGRSASRPVLRRVYRHPSAPAKGEGLPPPPTMPVNPRYEPA